MSEWLERLIANLDFWAALGVVGQLVFASRMLVQWYVSEKRRESTVPVSFWWISIFGSILVLVYGFKHAQMPVILGQMFGFVVYIRNLMLIYGKAARDRVEFVAKSANGDLSPPGEEQALGESAPSPASLSPRR